VRLLAVVPARAAGARPGSLLVVGDSDQSIYGWRGAKETLLRSQLLRDLGPSCLQLSLPSNYRSTPEVLAAARLITWSVTGPDLRPLAAALRGRTGIEQVVAFGNTLHVSGRDADRMSATIAAVRDPRHAWSRIDSGLEDVFISLMDEAQDNFS
jgi:hypothetical protein